MTYIIITFNYYNILNPYLTLITEIGGHELNTNYTPYVLNVFLFIEISYVSQFKFVC